MNIRQLHDELRKPGACKFGFGVALRFTKTAKGYIQFDHKNYTLDAICHVDELERDDWSVTRAKSPHFPPQTGGGE